MSGRPGRLRRAWEWLWRGAQLRELREQRLPPAGGATLLAAKSCQTLAWRVLSGLEPIPASTRDAVARPLILAGMSKCASLATPVVDGVERLFADQTWQEQLKRGGVEAEALPTIEAWLFESSAAPGTGELALRALGALIEAIEGPRHGIRRIFWRRVTLALVLLASLFGAAAALVALLTPPEGPDLAVGKPWQASSFYPGFPASGNKPANPPEGAFFSTTNEESNPWWMVDLQSAKSVGGVTVVNRSDCCLERAHPVVIELSTDGKTWKEVARRTELFRTWRATFAPHQARYVRLRALRRTHLHFKDVRVLAPRGAK